MQTNDGDLADGIQPISTATSAAPPLTTVERQMVCMMKASQGVTQSLAETTKVFSSIGSMMRLRERDAIYGESKESKVYFVNENEKAILLGKPVPFRKAVEVARAFDEVLTHTLPRRDPNWQYPQRSGGVQLRIIDHSDHFRELDPTSSHFLSLTYPPGPT
jgi:hypothetical protein